jgi:hypothetical protein
MSSERNTMKSKDAKKILRDGVLYYTKRGVVGNHWDEWKAVEHVLAKWERSDAKLRHVRILVKELLEKWKDDARHGRGATLGIADRINKILKELK